MSSLIRQTIAQTPLRDLSIATQAIILAVAFPILAVVINVLVQVALPKDKSKPPVVFHYFPIIGSAVTYGIDPITFFRNCKEQVRQQESGLKGDA